MMTYLLYFAYGSNLDPVHMRERCPDAIDDGPALGLLNLMTLLVKRRSFDPSARFATPLSVLAWATTLVVA